MEGSLVTNLQVFLDTEFVASEGDPILVSIGIAADNSREFYAERSMAELGEIPEELLSDFIRREVLPQLGAQGVTSGSLREIAGLLSSWLLSLNADVVEVIYDYSADFELVEQLQALSDSLAWSRLVPVHVGYLLEDTDGVTAADKEWTRLGAETGMRRHHSLADAWALRARFRAVHPK